MTEIPDRPVVALIAGPTASGKSALALEMAEREDGVIINADASQVYRDLRVLTARPTAEDEARAPHALYGYRDGAMACSAAAWAADARRVIAGTIASKRLPILVGGTGLYLRTLIDGIAPVPPIDARVRAQVRAMSGPEAHAALQQEDPVEAIRLHPNDTTRNQRALEVVRSTGRRIGEWRSAREGGIGDSYRFAVRLIDLPVAELSRRCDYRAAAMIAHGACEEVARLAARNLDPALPVMRAIGVEPVLRLINNKMSQADAIGEIRNATRRYAKRQRTWFRNQRLAGDV